MGLCGSYDLNIDHMLFTCAWKTQSHTCESRVNKWDWILKSRELLETPCVKSVGTNLKPCNLFLGVEDPSEESWLLHKRISSLVLAQRLHRICSRSVTWNVREININITSPTYRKTKKLHCSQFSQLQPGNVPTYCPPKFYPFLSLLHLLQTSWAAQLLHEHPLPFSMVPMLQTWGRVDHQPSLPSPAHGGHRSLQHRLENSPFLNSHAPELSWRGWRLFHIFPHASMIKPSYFSLLLSLA